MTGAAGGERSRLVRALALSRRFHLYLARCASPRAADQLVAELSAELPRRGRAEVRLVRLEPYGARTEDTPLTDGELADRVLLPLLDPPDELRGAIHLVDASRAAYADTEPWARVFSLWNEKRNVLGPSHGEVVVMLPRALAPVFAAAAPDVWSIRSGEYVIEEDAGAPNSLPGTTRVARGLSRDMAIEPILESHKIGAPALVGGVEAAFSSLTAAAPASEGRRVNDALLLMRAVSPLALFGGDIVVRPWVDDLLSVLAAAEITEPSVVHPPGPLRDLHFAIWDLASRDFRSATGLFSGAIERLDGDSVAFAVGACSGLAIALAAQDRAAEAVPYADRALRDGDGSLHGARDAMYGALRANAFVHWCLGHLERAQELDQTLATEVEASTDVIRSRLVPIAARSHLLRLAERGQVAAARGRVAALLDPGPHASSPRRESVGVDVIMRVVISDLDFLTGDLDASLWGLERALAEGAPWPKEHASLARRCEAAKALVEIARGNEERAAKLLRHRRDGRAPSDERLEPDGGFRAEAFGAVASGLLSMVMGNPWDAAMWFMSARSSVAQWGDWGLDRRSRLRAELFVELLGAAVDTDADHALASARSLADQAEALLGDTAEDHMSRVLAVAAHRELARRLASAGAGDARSAAQRAAALAQPLGGLGVPAWDELLRAAARPS
ncbi:hypothetical protein WMF11_17365 [Sorangium sp. So ce295]|uniref:hypothetical protein n=1 Tax=Sorangium sp. So ce295 TaxID=3133295 RepID=UPI003F5FA9C7